MLILDSINCKGFDINGLELAFNDYDADIYVAFEAIAYESSAFRHSLYETSAYRIGAFIS